MSNSPKKVVEIACQGAVTVALKELHDFQGNLKDLSETNFKKLRKEILELGFSEPFSAWRNKDKWLLLNGHQRARVLREMAREGYQIPPLPVNPVRCKDEKEAKLKVLALTSQYGEMTGEGLYEFVSQAGITMPEITESFSFADIDLTSFNAEFFESDTNEDDAPPVPSVPVCKPGQLWALGNHRLLCGDATRPDDVKRLMGNDLADMVFTDPPYGVDYSAEATGRSKAKKWKSIKNDDLAGVALKDFFGMFLDAALPSLQPHASLYICIANLTADALALALKERSVYQAVPLVWVKKNAPISWHRYHPKHEMIVFAGEGAKPTGAKSRWYGPKNEVTVWEEDNDAGKDYQHPTQKPVALPARAIRNSSQGGGLVLDPFGGSGSTLIACEQLKRKCRMIELEPAYCDVIIGRWENLTGKKAENIS